MPRKLDGFDANAMGGWEQVAVEFFDRTRPLGKEADHFSLTDEICEPTTPEARPAVSNGTRRDLEELVRHQLY